MRGRLRRRGASWLQVADNGFQEAWLARRIQQPRPNLLYASQMD
jgi:hypothetical protein